MSELFQVLLDQGVFVALFITFFAYNTIENNKREAKLMAIIENYIIKEVKHGES